MYIVAVAIKTPLYKTFDYKSDILPKIGARILINFAGREVVAIVLKHKENSTFKLKNIQAIIDTKPILSKVIITQIIWCANYYSQPIGEVCFAAIPKKLRLGKDAVIKKELTKQTQVESDLSLNTEQSVAIQEIIKSFDTYQAFLLHGITGSGKTEVYLQIAKQILQQGKQVLVLVPEIGLTPQMFARFATRLNTKVATIHSGLNSTQKLDNWLYSQDLECGIILGTRSAIWTDIPRLGLIIVDEEHDSSFKQQSSPRYSAKSLAFVRAQGAKIPIVLGSATPSLESLKLLIDKKITHILLKNRASGALPKITITDTRQENTMIASSLQQKITQHLDNNKQIMIFINRRGYAPIYHCTSCGWEATCSACDRPLVYHIQNNKLKCHSCESIFHTPVSCEGCGAHTLVVSGYGTQRLEEHLASKFINTEIIRIDRDSTTKKSDFKNKLKRINTGEPCIIVGTQMLAKGHDFSNVALVGVLGSDGSLLSSNFRATEYLAQLLIQVSGRAGRADDCGEVIIQTKFSDYPIFNFIKHHNYAGFAKELLLERKNSLMPPFSYNALICANSKQSEQAKKYLLKCRQILMSIEIDNINIFSVVEANPLKKADYYYFHLNLYSANRQKLNSIIKTFIQNMPKLEYGIRWFVDIDPLD